MKIFAAGIATESNTFCPVPTSLEDFLVQRGQDGMVKHPSLDLSAIWGNPARDRGAQFVFSLMAWAPPSGRTVRSAYESLRDEILHDLKATLPVDIVLLMLHGAMVAEGYDDCEADLIHRIRQISGMGTVIGVELDLHCHLTVAKIAPANIVLTFKEYPHTDINDRARELFALAIGACEGRTRPTMSLFDCRMIGLYPTSQEPLRQLVDSMIEAEQRDRVLSISLGHGFQFADLEHVGTKVLVVTDNSMWLAEQLAREFGMRVYGIRERISFASMSLSLEKALSRASTSVNTPVVVADQSDNVGGGAPGDSTFALRWLLEHDATDAGIAILYDPEVVRIASKAGAGSSLGVRLGGKMGVMSGQPVDVDVTVLSRREDYSHALPQQSGETLLFPAGDVVALRCGDGIDIVVSSQRCQCFSPSVFSDLGIDPKTKRLLVPKSTQHFYAGFAPLAGEIIYMAGPGAVAPDPRRIPYRRLNTSRLYPWAEDPLGLTTAHGG